MQLYLKAPSQPENYTVAVLYFVARFYQGDARLTVFFILKDMLDSVLRLVSHPRG
jgi:hypothetical protein